MSYADFLARKHRAAPDCGIAKPVVLHPALFPFQRDITRWALRKGRAAIWADCGLGKTVMALEWARHIPRGPVLILTPLAVAPQFVEIGRDVIGLDVRHVRDGAELGKRGVHVTNYDRAHRFDFNRLGGVVLDESSILKDHTAATRTTLIRACQGIPFRLACTATPAPNDQEELGNHAEFLSVMTRTEMLSTFFCHDGGETQTWRLKGHARADFWRWVCSWAVALRKPSDLGYSDTGYDLPALELSHHVVDDAPSLAREAGVLFASEVRGLQADRAARRSSLDERVTVAARLVNAESSEPWIVWCDLNAEGDALSAAIPGAVQVAGADAPEEKEQRMADFAAGHTRVLVSKPSIAGLGLNWQHCARVVFCGVSHSFEAYYQAIRRTWRFGQRRPVHAHIVTSRAEGHVLANLRRKQDDAGALVDGMVREMGDLSRIELSATSRTAIPYLAREPMRIPSWLC